MRLIPLLLPVLFACSPDGGDSGAATAAGSTTEQPKPNPYKAAKGSCPVFETGTVSTKAGGVTRQMEVELPADPNGAPVVLAWHWLGSDATELLNLMQIRGLADDGYIVVAPETSGLPYEWDSYTTSDDNVDLELVDKILPCLYEQFAHDSDRVYATGMSAGGLFTTFLTMHRADVLAATAVFSGGTSAATYSEPDLPITSLVTWGGVSDTYSGFDFHQPSLDFVDLLNDDGAFAIPCQHSLGHLPPFESPTMLRLFFGDHELGVPSPWEGGLPGGLPNFCSMP